MSKEIEINIEPTVTKQIQITVESTSPVADPVQMNRVKYDDVSNKPKINGVELVGDKSSADLKLAGTVKTDNTLTGDGDKEPLAVNTEVIATKEDLEGKADKSDIPDVSGFATKDELTSKQDKLTPGENITIEDGVISAAGGELPDNILVNNATDANSVFIGNDLPQYADGGKGNVLIGPASKITNSSGTGNTVIGVGAYGKGYDGTSLGRGAVTEGQWAIAVGHGANANASGAVAVGVTAAAKGAGTVVIGKDAKSESPNGANVVIGQNAKATGYVIKSVAIGVDARANAYESTAVGAGANTGLDYSIAIGHYAKTTVDNYITPESNRGEGNIAIGLVAESSNNCSIAIGDYSQSHGKNAIALGADANASMKNAIVIGSGASVEQGVSSGDNQISIGTSATSEGQNAITLGNSAYGWGDGSISIGYNSNTETFYAIAIGAGATTNATNNQEGMLGQDNIAIGTGAKSTVYKAISLGSGAKAHAYNAIQLGEGINTEEGSLQVYNYTLLRENGVIPYSRLSDFNSPTNGQVLAYNEEEDALYWKDAGGGVSEVKWGDITGSITDQTDLSTQFSNLSQSISDINDTIMEMTTKDESLQTQINNLSAIGQFLAIWDCDTHIARYLDEGYTYQAGNYFIIGSVAAEGGTNYMPNGASYPGYTETTEDVKVSDMWFYDGEHWIYLANHERAIAVDAELNAESINPVENKAVTAAIVELQNRPTGVGVPQLASVDVLQLKTPEEAEERERNYGSWKGMYSDIVVTLNLNKQEIIDRMYDLYLTVSRFKTNRNLTYDVDGEAKNYRNISKFSVMNDLRQKTNIRAYCWRMIYDDSLPEAHPGRYAYFYTQDLYVDEQACLEYAHDIGLWGDYSGVACGPATCLNAIGWENGYTAKDYYQDYRSADIPVERYEEGDISEFANVADTGTYPEYNLKDHLTKRECRRYTRDGENYFFWCSNWDDSSAAIYNITDGNDNPIPNGIPKHMDQLYHVWNVFDFPSTFEFVDKRPDLNYKAVNDPYAFFEALQNLTFKGKYVDGDGRPTYWNCYWFDFPIMPVLLKDCEVKVMSGATKEDYSASVNAGEWHTLEYLANNGFLRALHDDKPIEIKLPYNTYYLWMRFCSLQKRCAYGDYSNWLDEEGRGIDNPMWPEQKLNLVEGVRDYNVLGRRAFARPRQAYRYGEYGKISEYIQFNVCSPMDAASGTKSKATPIQKKLTIDKHATTTIRN